MDMDTEQVRTETTGFVNESIARHIIDYDQPEEGYVFDKKNYDGTGILARYRRVDAVADVDDHVVDVATCMNFPEFKNHIQGYMGVRGTFKMKVTCSVTPFTSGLLLLAYIPPDVELPGVNLAITAATWRIFYSGFHHVLLNLARDSSIELEVPYVGETPYIPLYGSTGFGKQVGKFVLIPIIRPKSGVSPVSVSYDFYFALDKAEFYGTQPIEAVVQSAFGLSAVNEALKKSKVVSSGLGNISSWIGGSENPSMVTRAASWAIGGAGKILDIMGYSKPLDIKAVTPMVSLGYADVVNADRTFTGVVMANNSNAGIASMKMNGNGLDEMDIRNICGRYEFVKSAVVSNTTAVKSVVMNLSMSPRNFSAFETVSRDALDYHFATNTHLSYMSHFFAKWRGSFDFRIEPVCTRFHAGRFRVVVGPVADKEKVLANMSYTYSTVIALEDPNTWNFTVPFISMNPWRSTEETSMDNETPYSLSLFLETPLMVNGSVSSEIDLALFVKAGADFEFAELGPSFSLDNANMRNYKPWMYYIPQNPSANLGVEKKAAKIVEEAFSEVLDNQLSDLQTEVAEVQSSFELVPSQGNSAAAHNVAVGDPIRSVRSIIKRFTYSFASSASAYFAICTPWLPRKYVLNVHPDVDILSWVSPMYTFYRGGFRYFFNNYFPVRASLHNWRVPSGPYSNCATDVTAYQEQYKKGIVQVPTTLSEPLKIEVPYYQNLQAVNMWKNFQLGRNGSLPQSSSRASLGVFFDFYVGNTDGHVLRAGADNLEFGMLIAAPPTCLPVDPSSGP